VKRWTLAKQKARLKNWVQSRDLESDISNIEDALTDQEATSLDISVSSSGFASAVSARGAFRVLSGDSEGWADLYLGWCLRALRYRVQATTFDQAWKAKQGRGRIGVSRLSWIALNEACLCLAAAIAAHEDIFVEWLGPRLLGSLNPESPLVDNRVWEATPAEQFVIRLYARWRSQDFDTFGKAWPDSGGYNQMLRELTAPSIADAVVTQLCDYHCAHMLGDDDPFTTFPFDVLPAELLAVFRIRTEFGLPLPARCHPLLDSPLARFPVPFPAHCDDPLLQRVVSRCLDLLPGLEVPWE
jgi:hypothetical protein